MPSLDARIASLPIEPLAEMLRELAEDGEALATFCTLIDDASYDPNLALDRPTFSFMALTAISELQQYDSDPLEVLRCMQSALRLELRGAGSDVPLPDRIAALRPNSGER